MGEAARGVAVVEAGVDAAELQRLHALGVRGLRVNFVTPQSWGTTTPQMLATLADKVAPLGLASRSSCIRSSWWPWPRCRGLPVPLVVDHMARLDPAQGAGGEAFDLLCSLLDAGNTWVKLSGAYMRSSVGGPGYDDTLALGQALVHRAPERLVWGD